jgi:hypothetical protein
MSHPPYLGDQTVGLRVVTVTHCRRPPTHYDMPKHHDDIIYLTRACQRGKRA